MGLNFVSGSQLVVFMRDKYWDNTKKQEQLLFDMSYSEFQGFRS